MQYLMWRVLTGRHEKITLSFLIASHTKFAPDWAFGLFKRKFRRTQVDCLADIVETVKKSSTSGILTPQLCGDQAGNVIVAARDWTSFLANYFHKFKGLKQYHHFEFHSNGEVCVKLTTDSEPQVFSLRKAATQLPRDELPPLIRPRGLSHQRMMYLYEEIRD